MSRPRAAEQVIVTSILVVPGRVVSAKAAGAQSAGECFRHNP